MMDQHALKTGFQAKRGSDQPDAMVVRMAKGKVTVKNGSSHQCRGLMGMVAAMI